jgi:hypothetical protein
MTKKIPNPNIQTPKGHWRFAPGAAEPLLILWTLAIGIWNLERSDFSPFHHAAPGVCGKKVP